MFGPDLKHFVVSFETKLPLVDNRQLVLLGQAILTKFV